MSITDTQSYSDVIRDALFAKTVALPFFQGFYARRSKQLPSQAQHIPYLGVFIIDEVMVPDGDPNCTMFMIHTLRVGWQVVIRNNDPVQAELNIDAAFWSIMNGIWRDPKLMNFLNSDMPDNTRIEAVVRGTRKHTFGAPAFNQEQPVAELQYDASVRYRAEYFAQVTDDLLDIHVETVPMNYYGNDGSMTVPDASEVQRIISEYEFTPSKEAQNERAATAKRAGKADRRSRRKS
jgi:hypothetical protein